ncbi:glutathione S-transferase family protein [Neorhizobium galegae]|uniref:glutathione S-transferase family protein n=1 Tax=Neorhizobium galegae TaxID=399 RepID=UPI001F1FFF53|nr:glutathione S-transferase family protein [Neorhizobium galegae]UIK06280.1 glutathione S-transferase family protein [Neorhizobium galegae]
MRKPRLFGADYSVYVRTARLVLLEKAVDHELVPVDVFATGGPPTSHLERQPFGRIPAFEDGDFKLYETGAITRYVDEAFSGPALQPPTPRIRARMNQMIGIADSYVYPTLVWGIYVEQVSKPASGRRTDVVRLDAALERAPTCLKALAELSQDSAWLCGDGISLADLHLAPMIDYFMTSPVANDLLGKHSGLMSWWERVSARPSMLRTIPTG